MTSYSTTYAAVTTPVDPMNPTNLSATTRTTSDIAILGAGLAGLAAASRLRHRAASVALFEARERVGGHLSSSVERFTD